MEDQELDPALDPALDQVSRRSFLSRAAASAVATAASAAMPAQAGPQDALHDPALPHEDVTFKSGSQAVKAFLCRPPTAGRHGAVIVVHEVFGLTDHIRDVACRLARAGYVAMAPDLFTREGPPPPASEGIDKVMAFVGGIPDAQILGDLSAAAGALSHRRDTSGRAGLVGFCWGGYFAMLSAAEVRPLSAVVAYYGRVRLAQKSSLKPRAPIDVVREMKAPLLAHFGALDQSIPAADADALREELRRQGKTGEVHVYEGAGHAFNNDTRPSYNAEAARLAWQRTVGWFDRYVGGARG